MNGFSSWFRNLGAKIAAGILKTVSGQRRADALNRMAGKLLECKDAVFAANAEDIARRTVAAIPANMLPSEKWIITSVTASADALMEFPEK